QNPRENLDRRRLAGSVRPDEAEQLALLERERDVDQRVHDAMPTTDQSLHRAGESWIALGDAVRFGQLLNEDMSDLLRYATRASRVSAESILTRRVHRA